ncbi:RNA polymerase sigma factor [Streptomyces sp. NPDC059096]|uniref:RNA polymerase sigma factor n=1 Tax=Streptomyces sp. NPDC059096 TaxID=3346727 RepID=UPI0036AFC1AB
MDDWQEFEEVYRETSVPVLRFLRRRLPAQLAEDALSEVYLTAWRKRHDVRGEYLPWLYGIARLVGANVLRSAGRSYRLRELMLAAAEDRPEPAAEDGAMDRITAVEVLDRMPEKDREALILVSWDGLGTRQAARVAGCGVAAFSVRLHRARRRLEALLTEDEGNETERGSDDEYERGTGEGTTLGTRSGRRGIHGSGPSGA